MTRRSIALLLVGLGGLVALTAQSTVPTGTVNSIRVLSDRVRVYVDYPRATPLSSLGVVRGDRVTVLRAATACAGTWSAWTPTTDWSACAGGTQTRTESRTFTVTTPGTGCPSPLTETRTVSQACVAPVSEVWPDAVAPLDATILGDCSAAVHDRYIVDGGDGYRYRVWHPAIDPSGCAYAHEHGMDPDSQTTASVRSGVNRLFGYVSRRAQDMPGEPHGHVEAHEGYKWFVANRGQVNDEGRVNLIASSSLFHMGTGSPRRFVVRHHSQQAAWTFDDPSLPYAATNLMMDTGGANGVCDPRAGISKDGLVLGTCRVNSTYEIWSTTQHVMDGDRVLYTAFATPAVFDPITGFDPANPTAVIPVWLAGSPIESLLNFPNNDRSYYRGCDRESYAQAGNFYTGGSAGDSYLTDAYGRVVAPGTALALTQTIARSDRVGLSATPDGNAAFKFRPGTTCAPRLGLKN